MDRLFRAEAGETGGQIYLQLYPDTMAACSGVVARASVFALNPLTLTLALNGTSPTSPEFSVEF